MRDQYTSVEELPDETLDGIEVRHIRASKASGAEGTSETVEVWIGIEDGLPRKAVIERREAFDLMAFIRSSLSDPEVAMELAEYADDPIVFRGEGDIPDHRAWQWTFTFHSFNDPVEIEPPIPTGSEEP